MIDTVSSWVFPYGTDYFVTADEGGSLKGAPRTTRREAKKSVGLLTLHLIKGSLSVSTTVPSLGGLTAGSC